MKKQNNKQIELPLIDNKNNEAVEKAPATNLMKTVASKTKNIKNMEKVFTSDEIEKILMKRDDGDELTQKEYKAIREQYRKMKRRVKEMEKGNKEKIIVVPSITNKGGFYKLFDFSALYYVYRLANRMGRSAKLMSDSDKYSKTLYSASLVDINKFIEQFKRLENPKLEIAEDGIHIFTLKKPLTDDEVGELRLIEETRREKLHNVLKPKAADPAVFQGILMVIRQVAPRVRKLEKQYYYAIGEDMLRELRLLMASHLRG